MSTEPEGWQKLYLEMEAIAIERGKQLAAAVQMLSDQDFEYNRKTNELIDRHVKQLAATSDKELK